MMNKKASVGFFIAGLVTILIALSIIFAVQSEVRLDPIGAKQYDLLLSSELEKSAQLYVDASLTEATKEATATFVQYSGRKVEPSETGAITQNACGSYIYEQYNSLATFAPDSCVPDFKNTYVAYLNPIFYSYMQAYEDLPGFRASFFAQPAPGYTNIVGLVTKEGRIPLGTRAIVEDPIEYPVGALGTYGKERPITCSTGRCVMDVAQYFYDLYNLHGAQLPYVWGGESPYYYEDAVALRTQPDSIFYQTNYVTPNQPAPFFGATQPGFDCSGWVWWVAHHAGIPGFEERKTANEYLMSARDRATSLCDIHANNVECTKELIFEDLEAGDILFFSENKGTFATHIMLYNGSGEIIHSKSSAGLIQETIPEYYLENIIAAYRFPYTQGGVPALSGTKACSVPVDFFQIKEDLLCEGANANDVYEQLARGEYIDVITQVTDEVNSIPPEFVVAIITRETGALTDDYIRGTSLTNGQGFYGLMQVGENACTDANKIISGVCDWSILSKHKSSSDPATIKQVNEMSIRTGVAYLEWLMQFFNNKQNPDYFGLALAYNAGPTIKTEIYEYTVEQVEGVQTDTVQWRNVEAEYIDTILADRRSPWKNEPDGAFCSGERVKREEVPEYPNHVMHALSQLCDGQLSSGFQTRNTNSQSYLSFNPDLSARAEIDIDVLEKMEEEFVTAVIACNDKLPTCIDEAIQTFNTKYEGRATISIRGEENALALDIVSQVLDCKRNEQTDCYCDVTIDRTLPQGFNQTTVEFRASGDVYIGESAPTIELGMTPSSRSFLLNEEDLDATRLASEADEDHEYAQVFVLQSQSFIEFEETGSDERLSFTQNLGLYKDEDILSWKILDTEDREQMCYDNKEHFHFQIDLPAFEEPLGFSLQTTDQTPPVGVVFKNPEPHKCRDTKGIRLSWFEPPKGESIHEYEIYEMTNGKQLLKNIQVAAITDAAADVEETIRDAGEVLKDTSKGFNEYFYIITEDSAGQPINASSYSFQLATIDQYQNTAFSEVLSVQVPQTIPVLDDINSALFQFRDCS